jgi:hypothetical protein
MLAAIRHAAVDCTAAAQGGDHMNATRSIAASGRIANVALVLVFGGWLLLAWGVLRQLGDPSPTIPRYELERTREVSLVLMFCGITALIAAVWLSGRCFQVARIRAALVLAFCLVPTVCLFASAFTLHA